MNKAKRVSLCVLSLVIAWSCSNKWTINDRFEGVRGNTLRVYVRFDNIQGFDDEEDEQDVKKQMLLYGRKRTLLLFHVIIKSGIGDKDAPGELTGDIADIIKTSKIRRIFCNDDYCEAFIDYNIKNVVTSQK